MFLRTKHLLWNTQHFDFYMAVLMTCKEVFTNLKVWFARLFNALDK